ncbi:hypothetical protein [Aliivibrio fischeri]
MEVAGTRYYADSNEVASIAIGAKVEFMCEDDNEFDCNALAYSLKDSQ